ncbi:FAST kinase domain-containing protein 1, mitochondrial-like [Oratosquilla oratoria]|uniref:FAST kinase domain-containing protein 1, mitochondrial-like n=1 Tax=Oratosquilla oratoria TaxID=337810 RepID=UPI003F7646C3
MTRMWQIHPRGLLQWKLYSSTLPLSECRSMLKSIQRLYVQACPHDTKVHVTATTKGKDLLLYQEFHNDSFGEKNNFKTRKRYYCDQKESISSAGYENMLEDIQESDTEDTQDIVQLSFEQFDSLRVSIYSDSSDPVVKSLAQAASLQEVFDLVTNNDSPLTAEHISQAIITLWDLQKMYEKYGVEVPELLTSHVTEFLEGIRNHPIFQNLLDGLGRCYQELNDDALACMLLYLHRIGLKNSHPVMQNMVILALKRYKTFSLTALSRLSVYVRDQGLSGIYIQSRIINTISKHISNCRTKDELKLITICLLSMKKLVSDTVLSEYSTLVTKFLSEGVLDGTEPKYELKILKFFNHNEWSSKNNYLVRALILTLLDKVGTLSPTQIVYLNSHFQSNLEPREILKKIQEHAARHIEEVKNPEIKADLLLCLAPFSSHGMRSNFEELVAEILDGSRSQFYMSVIFKTLRFLKTSNTRLCNTFWNTAMESVLKSVEKVKGTSLGIEEIILRSVYQRYMYFNNNLGGTYRNYQLEHQMNQILLEELRHSSGILPSKMAKISSFLIGYAGKDGIPALVIDKIKLMSSQLQVVDTVALSRGIQIFLAMSPKHIQRSHMEQIALLTHILNTCTERHLKRVGSLVEITNITRAYLSRRCSPATFLFDDIINGHNKFLDQLNSRIVRDISMNFLSTRYLSPQIMDALANYVIENKDYVLGDVVERLLNCLYHLGYHPKNEKDFFKAAEEIIVQSHGQLQGLNMLQACLSLCLYDALSPELIHKIFNLSFLDQLDEEISNCYSKASYPAKVRHMLMELNRAVCIDHPQEKIPWFHEKYCQDLLETVRVPTNAFQMEVGQVLINLTGGPEFMNSNITTPYYYLIDFEFMLDSRDKFILVKDFSNHTQKKGSIKSVRLSSTPGFRRFAVLLRDESSYCINKRQLMGCHQLERRHLEILGYSVIEIPHFKWYSMANANFQDKLSYLRNAIFINGKITTCT